MSSSKTDELRRKARQHFDQIEAEPAVGRDVVQLRKDAARAMKRDAEQQEQLDALQQMFQDITHPKQRAFLAAYIKLAGAIGLAARTVGISHEITWVWRKTDPRFLAAFELATDLAVETMEAEALRRAFFGTKKGVYYEGERVDEETVYSDNLAMFMLKGARPARYRDQTIRQEITGDGGGPLVFKVVYETPKVIDAAYELLPEDK